MGVLGAVAVVTYLNRSRSRGGELVQQVKRDRHPVQTMIVAPRNASQTVEHTAVLEANRDVTLTAEVGGKVLNKSKRMGDACRRGEALLRLDAEPYRIARAEAAAQLQQSRLRLEQSRRDLERTDKLARRSVVSGEALEQMGTAVATTQAAVARAQALLDRARRDLRQASVRCPFDGQVAATMVELGQLVTPQTPLARLVDLSRLKLEIKVAAPELARLRVGQQVSLHDPAQPDRRFAGEVSRLGVAADPATNTFPVEVLVPGSAAGQPRPGQVVRSTIVVADHQQVLLVPQNAVLAREGSPSLFVVQGKRASLRAVTLGPRVGEERIITRGIEAKAQVIIVGHHALRDGDPIEVTRRHAAPNEPTAAAAGAPGPQPAKTPVTPKAN